MSIAVQREDFDLSTELRSLATEDKSIGAVCSFVGLVKDMAGDDEVKRMTLEHYPGMTEKQLKKIAEEARRRWPLKGLRIIHRYGTLEAGEQIVLVISASRNRGSAFESCHFVVDQLKTRAPFWKSEENQDGRRKWVEAVAGNGSTG